jgi:predicted dehydrogenase
MIRNDNDNIRFGFIGAGTMGTIHMETFRQIPGVELTAVADVSEARANQVAAEYGVAKAYSDSGRLIADPNVAAVVVSVPNAFHAELAIAALEAGKHVLLEKPMAMNAEEARNVMKAQQASGKTLMIGHQMRWNAEIAEAKRRIEEGKLGRIYYMKAGWLRRMGIPGWGTAYTSQAMMGGGSAVDIGVHMLDLALYLSAPRKPIGVYGAAFGEIGKQRKGIGTWGVPNWNGAFDVDDLATAMIRLDDGAMVHLEVSWAAYTDGEDNGPYLHVMGDQGGLIIRDSGSLFLTEENGESVDYPFSAAQEEEGAERLKLAGHFLSCIRTGDIPITDGLSGFVNQAVLDALYRSSRTGAEAKVDLSFGL